MLGRSVTFGQKSVEKLPQQGNFFELTTAIACHFGFVFVFILAHEQAVDAKDDFY